MKNVGTYLLIGYTYHYKNFLYNDTLCTCSYMYVFSVKFSNRYLLAIIILTYPLLATNDCLMVPTYDVGYPIIDKRFIVWRSKGYSHKCIATYYSAIQHFK